MLKTIFPRVPDAIIEISDTELVFNHPIEDIFVKFRNISVQINRAKTPTEVLDAQQWEQQSLVGTPKNSGLGKSLQKLLCNPRQLCM